MVVITKSGQKEKIAISDKKVFLFFFFFFFSAHTFRLLFTGVTFRSCYVVIHDKF